MAEEIIPFGKYKGQEIAQIKQRDPAYLQWLTQQSWFVEKFSPVYQLVVNNFAPPSEDTPAHNALQVQFLQVQYQLAFWEATNLYEPIKEDLITAFRRRIEHRTEAPKALDNRAKWRVSNHRQEVREKWKHWRIIRKAYKAPKIMVEIGRPTFEDVTDVIFPVDITVGDIEGYDWEYWNAYRRVEFAIEIKPSLGDDYPAVLRQMKRQRTDNNKVWFLLVDEFGSNAVTFEQVQMTFALDRITILRVSDMREHLIRVKAERRFLPKTS